MTDRQRKLDSTEDPAISDLYRTTRDAVPSAELDAKILHEAESIAHRRRRHWLLPLSSAAVVLLGLTLTLRLVDQPPSLQLPVEDVSQDLPAEVEALPPVEKKQIIPEPAMMMDSIPRRARQEGAMLQKTAPSSSVPVVNKEEYLNGSELFETREAKNHALQSDEIEEDPTVWLARIESDLARGERAKAIQELQAFMLRYPDYPLPKTLQELSLD